MLTRQGTASSAVPTPLQVLTGRTDSGDETSPIVAAHLDTLTSNIQDSLLLEETGFFRSSNTESSFILRRAFFSDNIGRQHFFIVGETVEMLRIRWLVPRRIFRQTEQKNAKPKAVD